MYHCVIVKSFIFTEEIWHRVGIYAEPVLAKKAQNVIEEAFIGCSCIIRQFATPERAKAEFPKELPAAALIPHTSELSQMVAFYQAPEIMAEASRFSEL
jgi:hypothetical protein